MLAAALIDHNVHGPVQALRWDVATNCYEVIDGGLFERRFDELRRKRDRDDGSNGRPFSRMHKYYKLAVGERWAKTVKLHVASALHYYACASMARLTGRAAADSPTSPRAHWIGPE